MKNINIFGLDEIYTHVYAFEALKVTQILTDNAKFFALPPNL